MPMPKTAVDEYRLTEATKDDVRCAGKVTTMEAETKPQAVNQSADNEFRRRMRAFDSSHER
jgi:hypothetical protein